MPLQSVGKVAVPIRTVVRLVQTAHRSSDEGKRPTRFRSEIADHQTAVTQSAHSTVAGKLGLPSFWSAGPTREHAIGALVLQYPELFGIEIDESIAPHIQRTRIDLPKAVRAHAAACDVAITGVRRPSPYSLCVLFELDGSPHTLDVDVDPDMLPGAMDEELLRQFRAAFYEMRMNLLGRRPTRPIPKIDRR